MHFKTVIVVRCANHDLTESQAPLTMSVSRLTNHSFAIEESLHNKVGWMCYRPHLRPRSPNQTLKGQNSSYVACLWKGARMMMSQSQYSRSYCATTRRSGART